MVVFAVVFSPTERPDRLAELSYATTSDSELYFRNVRSYYYTTTDTASGTLQTHRLKKLNGVKGILHPYVVVNSSSNEAFIRFDGFETFTGSALTLTDQSGDTTLVLAEPNNDEQLLLAALIFRLKESELSVILNDSLEIWTSPGEMQQVRTVLYDYFKLVNKL